MSRFHQLPINNCGIIDIAFGKFAGLQDWALVEPRIFKFPLINFWITVYLILYLNIGFSNYSPVTETPEVVEETPEVVEVEKTPKVVEETVERKEETNGHTENNTETTEVKNGDANQRYYF